jgi:hypothetical protein
MQAFCAKHELDPDTPDFHASNGFVYDFKTRNGFRSRRAHLKRRPTIESDVEATWVEAIQNLRRSVSDGGVGKNLG